MGVYVYVFARALVCVGFFIALLAFLLSDVALSLEVLIVCVCVHACVYVCVCVCVCKFVLICWRFS